MLYDHSGIRVNRRISAVTNALRHPTKWTTDGAGGSDAVVYDDEIGYSVGTDGQWFTVTTDVAVVRCRRAERAARIFLNLCRDRQGTSTMAKKKTAVAGDGKSKGLVGGLGVTATWNALLAANAKAKLTDEQLTARMQEEFPDRDKFQPVARVRSWYNNGKFGFGTGPNSKLEGAARSYGYDENGVAISRSGPPKKTAAPAKAASATKKKKKTTTAEEPAATKPKRVRKKKTA